MTAGRRAGRTVVSPSRLARTAPPLRGCGLDRLPPPRRVARKRSWFKVSGTAPFATWARVPWRRDRPFRPDGLCAILPQCPGTAPLCATAPRSVNCRPISMSCPVPGRALAAPSNTTSRHGVWGTTGPRGCRSQMPRWTCSKRGSATCSTNCLGRGDDVRRVPV